MTIHAFAVCADYDDEGYNPPVAIFSSREKADAAAVILNAQHSASWGGNPLCVYTVFDYTIDEFDPDSA